MILAPDWKSLGAIVHDGGAVIGHTCELGLGDNNVFQWKLNFERGAVVHDEGIVIGHPCDGNMSDHYNHDSGNNEKEVSENSG